MKMPTSRKARLEYLAIEKKAEELLNKGHSFRSAYKIFYEARKITMSYDTFRRYALGLFTSLEQRRGKYTEPSEANTSLAVKQPSTTLSHAPEGRNSPRPRLVEAQTGEGSPHIIGIKTCKFGELHPDYDPLGLDKENN